jgi:hypothetical protein
MTCTSSVVLLEVRKASVTFRNITRADFVLDQSAHLFTFLLSANHNAGNAKFTPRRTRKYCHLLVTFKVMIQHIKI